MEWVSVDIQSIQSIAPVCDFNSKDSETVWLLNWLLLFSSLESLAYRYFIFYPCIEILLETSLGSLHLPNIDPQP